MFWDVLFVESWIIQSPKRLWMMYSFDLRVFKGKLVRNLRRLVNKVRERQLFQNLIEQNNFVDFPVIELMAVSIRL